MSFFGNTYMDKIFVFGDPKNSTLLCFGLKKIMQTCVFFNCFLSVDYQDVHITAPSVLSLFKR